MRLERIGSPGAAVRPGTSSLPDMNLPVPSAVGALTAGPHTVRSPPTPGTHDFASPRAASPEFPGLAEAPAYLGDRSVAMTTKYFDPGRRFTQLWEPIVRGRRMVDFDLVSKSRLGKKAPHREDRESPDQPGGSGCCTNDRELPSDAPFRVRDPSHRRIGPRGYGAEIEPNRYLHVVLVPSSENFPGPSCPANGKRQVTAAIPNAASFGAS